MKKSIGIGTKLVIDDEGYVHLAKMFGLQRSEEIRAKNIEYVSVSDFGYTEEVNTRYGRIKAGARYLSAVIQAGSQSITLYNGLSKRRAMRIAQAAAQQLQTTVQADSFQGGTYEREPLI